MVSDKLIVARNAFEASNLYAQQLGFGDYEALYNACHHDVEDLGMIYATIFNKTTKKPVGPSAPLGVNTLSEAEKLFTDKPIERTKNTLIYEQVGDSRLCVSWIRFSL